MTAYTAGQTTATVSRGQEGTTNQAHVAGSVWLHGPTARDFQGQVAVPDTPGLGYQPGWNLYATSKWSPTKRPLLYEPDLLVVIEPETSELRDVRDNNAYWNRSYLGTLAADQSRATFGSGPYFRPSHLPSVSTASPPTDIWSSYSDGCIGLDKFTVLAWVKSVGADWSAQSTSAATVYLAHFGALDNNSDLPAFALSRPAGSLRLDANLWWPNSGQRVVQYTPASGVFAADTWVAVWVTWDGTTLRLLTGTTQRGTAAGAIPAPYSTFPISDPKETPGMWVGGTAPIQVAGVGVLRYVRTNNAQLTDLTERTIAVDPSVTQGAFPKALTGTNAGYPNSGANGAGTVLAGALGLGAGRMTTGHESTPITVTNHGTSQTYNFASSIATPAAASAALGIPFHFQMNYVPINLQSVPGNEFSAPIHGAAGASTQKGVWAGGTTYAINDTVTVGGRAFTSLQNANTGNAPPASGNTAFWQELYPEFTLYFVDHLDYLVNTAHLNVASIGFINEPLSTASDWVAPNGNADLTNLWLACAIRVANDSRLTGKVPVMGTCDCIYDWTDRSNADGPVITAQLSAAHLNAMAVPPVNIHDYSGSPASIRHIFSDINLYCDSISSAHPTPRLTEWNWDQRPLSASWESNSANAQVVRSPYEDPIIPPFYYAVVRSMLEAGGDVALLFGFSKSAGFYSFGPALTWTGGSSTRTLRPWATYQMLWKHSGTRISADNGGWPDLWTMASTTGGTHPEITVTFARYRPYKPMEKARVSFVWSNLPASYTWTLWLDDYDNSAGGQLMRVASGDESNLPSALNLAGLSTGCIQIRG